MRYDLCTASLSAPSVNIYYMNNEGLTRLLSEETATSKAE